MPPDTPRAARPCPRRALRPDLYAAYIHGGSQWDGAYDPVAENRVAVYIFMAKMTNITAPKRHGTPMRTSMPPMKRQG